MNESVKPRFAIDLNEIEKQLGPHGQAAQVASTRPDPLAELARIVGQDDPFQSLLAGDRAPRPANEPSLDDLFVARDERRGGAAPNLRSTYEPDDRPANDPYGQLGASYAEYQAKVEADSEDPNFSAPFYGNEPQAEPYRAGEPGEAQGGRKSRKLLLAAGVVGGLAVLGVGGALMLNSPATLMASGDPPLIKATNEPSKVQPQSPGGVEIPNQNKQIYERAARDTQTKVVNREEQPVDVRQAARSAGAPDAPARPAASVTPPAGNGLNLGEPRKVRTVSIRPDGSIATADASPTTRAPEPATMPAPMTMPSAAAAAPQPAAASATPSQTRAMPPVAPTTPAPTTPGPKTVASTPSTAPAAGGASPQQPAAPPPAVTAQPAQPKVAAAQPMALAPITAPAAAETASVGGFAVQLGVSGSEADARTTLQRLQQKFPDLGGTTPLIRKAEVNGNTVYRVRVGPMTREDASSLCSKLQGQGGQCFVAKN